MADDSDGKSIADAYRRLAAPDTAAAAAPSEGATIADAYRTQNANTPPPAAKSWQDEYFPPPDAGDIMPSPDNPVTRIVGAAAEGWRGGTMQTPAAYAENQKTLLGQYVVHPLVEFGNLPLRALGALGRGGAQAIYEIGEPLGRAMPEIRIPDVTLPSDGSITYPGGITIARPGRGLSSTVVGGPGLGRDLNLLTQVLPFAADMRAPGAMRPNISPSVTTPSARFVQEYYGEGTPGNPLLSGPAPGSQTMLDRITGAIRTADSNASPLPPGAAPPVPPPAQPPPFIPPGTSPYPPGAPRAVDAPPYTSAGNALAYGTPTEAQPGVAAAPGTPTAVVPPITPAPVVSPTAAPSPRIAPIVTQAQAEAEADRILRHFAGDQPVVINSTPLASGAQPTLSQSVEGGHGGLAGLERGVRDVAEQNQHFVARETANTTLRNKAVGDVIGDSRATDVTEAELNKRTAPQEAAIFDPARTKPVDPSDAIALLDQIRGSGKGQRDAVANALDHLRGKLIDKDGNMQTDPAQLRGVDLAIKDMISPMAAGTKQDGRAAAHELMAVRDVLRDNIEQGAPGYKDFLAQQAAERSAIDGQRFLQARNITDRQGNVNLGALDSTIKAAERQQAMPGARLADGVTDEQLDRLRQLRADYQNDAKQRLGTSIGSPTVQKFGVSGSMGVMGHPLLAGGAGVAGAWAAGASNPLLGAVLGGAGYLLKQQSLKGQRMVMDALRDKLLNPEKARSAFAPPPTPP